MALHTLSHTRTAQKSSIGFHLLSYAWRCPCFRYLLVLPIGGGLASPQTVAPLFTSFPRLRRVIDDERSSTAQGAVHNYFRLAYWLGIVILGQIIPIQGNNSSKPASASFVLFLPPQVSLHIASLSLSKNPFFFFDFWFIVVLCISIDFTCFILLIVCIHAIEGSLLSSI